MDAERSLLAQGFRTLADTFTRLAAEAPPDPRTLAGKSIGRREDHATDTAGKLTVQAHRRGWLKILGLDAMVAEVENPPDPPAGARCYRVPCPANLFLRLAGNDQLPVVNDAGTLRVTGPTAGGVLPELYPDALPGHPFTTVDGPATWEASCAHHATVCRWLAAAVEKPTRTKKTEPLTDSQEAVYQVILREGPVQGRKICAVTGDEWDTLRRHIIPALKKKRGVKNMRGAGYYVP